MKLSERMKNWDKHNCPSDAESYMEEVKALESALANVYMVAKREKRRAKKAIDMAAWTHILCFCEEAGCESTLLRDERIGRLMPEGKP